ncbi:TlpA family protein disulfide reductase [Candidatus Poribacteria bacterium]|nr:TlpA family protein disulfide reductase [Candidatus Poribacteria bacterium]
MYKISRKMSFVSGVWFSFFIVFLFCKQKNVFGMSRLKLGEKVKTIDLNTQNGERFDFKKFQNKNNLIVVFWKIPEGKDFIDYSHSALEVLKKISLKYQSENLKIIAVYCPWGDDLITKDELETIKTIRNELDINFPILIDAGLKVYNQYGISALPSFLLIDNENVVKYILAGYPSHSAENIIQIEVKKLVENSSINNNFAKKVR